MPKAGRKKGTKDGQGRGAFVLKFANPLDEQQEKARQFLAALEPGERIAWVAKKLEEQNDA